MATKTVIAGSDNVTAKQLKELMNQIDQGIITGKIIQNLLDHAKDFAVKPLDIGSRLPSLLLLIKNGADRSAVTDGMAQKDFMLSEFNFRIWDDTIMHSVNCFRSSIQALDTTTHNSYIARFQQCWKKIDDAKNDSERAEAVAFLGFTMTKE